MHTISPTDISSAGARLPEQKSPSPVISAPLRHTINDDGGDASLQRTPVLGQALPQWERPAITPTAFRRVYRVPSESRPGLIHVVDLNECQCSCESWVFQGRGDYPRDHALRACKHIKDAEIYEAERAARASQAVDELCGVSGRAVAS